MKKSKDTEKKDQIYAKPQTNIPEFEFDEKVSLVFDNMIARSVPGYDSVATLFPILVRKYAKENTNIYDLGCSTGALSKVMLQFSSAHVIAVDNSEDMLQRAGENIGQHARLELLCQDIMTLEMHNASLVVMNYTLQFIHQSHRDSIIAKIYRGLNPGGALLLTEKIKFDNCLDAQIATELHEDFKRFHGYSELEISQKRSALERVLVPETIQDHQVRMKNAGFESSFMWFRSLNFASFLAVKS